MSVRRATWDDLQRLVDLMAEVVDQHVDHLPDVFERAKREDMIDYLGPMLDSEDARVFVACSGTEIVGYMLLTVDDDPGNAFFRPRRLLYIEALAVTAAHRRHGHGATLLDAARRVAVERGLDHVEFETWGFNEQAHEYFGARGFQPLSFRMSGKA
jgi:ribosomal protein S18 acetylase RimI-like enzyme